MKNKKFKIRKKAMSEVVSSVLMVALVLILVGVTWAVVNNMVNQKLKNSEACFGNFDKITINQAYTCYNSTTNEFYFSINVGDISLDSLSVVIGSQGTTRSISLTSTSTNIAGVTNYPLNTTGITAPVMNAGKTYIYAGSSVTPEYVRISPVIGGEKCQESDALTNIETCSFY